MNRPKTRVRAARRAFTLLEVLMVLVILGLLAGLVVWNLSNVGEKAKEETTRTNVKLLEGPIDLFHMQVGRYPTTLQELSQKPEDENEAKKWAGPYIKDPGSLKDGWGKDLIYKSPGEHNTDSYDLYSVGKDGNEGTEDDIGNWTKT